MSDPGPVFDQINLVVRDMDATIEFYRRLGVDVEPAGSPWARHHRSATGNGEMDIDFDSQTFAALWDEGWPRGRSGVVVGFRLASREAVDAMYAELTGGGHARHQPPYDAFWGARYAIVEDPDGTAVGLMSPADPARRTPPPAVPD